MKKSEVLVEYILFVKQHGVSLLASGFPRFALEKIHALRALDMLTGSSVVVLGGDVVFIKDGEPRYSRDSWASDLDKSLSDYENSLKNIAKARYYIEHYPEQEGLIVAYDFTLFVSNAPRPDIPAGWKPA